MTLAAVLFLVRSVALAEDLPANVPAGEIAGTVTNEDGQPIEGALVDACTWQPGNETKTDKDGHYHLNKLDRHSRIELRISKDGFDPWYNPQQETAVADLNVALNNRTYFEGAVTSPDDKSVAGALIRADNGPKQGDGVIITNVWTETTSDANGHYRLYVAPDKYDIQIRVPGIGAARLTQSISDGDTPTLDIKLDKGATFIANVVDSETGEPVPGVKLDNWQHKGIEGTSDDKGVITIDGMQNGKFEFDVSAEGYVRWWSGEAVEQFQRTRTGRSFDSLTFDIEPDMPPVTITIEKGVTITGHVFDPDGKPVQGATVAPARTGSGNSITGDTRFSVGTKADGSYMMLLPSTFDGQYNLIAHDGPYGKTRNWGNGVGEPFDSKPGDKIEDVKLTLTNSATVKGHVTDTAGNPAADKEVRAISTDGLDNRYYVASTRTDKDGSYELKLIRPTEMMIQAEPFWLRPGETTGESTQTVTLGEKEVKEGVDLVSKGQ